jgi:hypothetical protein
MRAGYLHRGIAARPFERRFQLADFIEVDAARFENGLLSIQLKRVVPESMKPRKIEISGGELRPIRTSDRTAARYRAGKGECDVQERCAHSHAAQVGRRQ